MRPFECTVYQIYRVRIIRETFQGQTRADFLALTVLKLKKKFFLQNVIAISLEVWENHVTRGQASVPATMECMEKNVKVG